jgi:Fungal Zn(2)-Cys(6) binuclear cluster domain
MPQSELSLRRNGRPQACEPCRRSKHRCDHSTPICNRCIVLGKPALCFYHPAPMTKVREGSVASPARLPKLLPESRTLPQTIRSLSPLAYEVPRTTLFKRPGSRYAMTSVSAVFSENQDQIGADLLDVEEEEPTKVYDDPVRMKLAIETLRAFPSPQTCQLLLIPLTTIHDVTISQKMITHCLNSVWSTFGHALKGSRPNNKLSKIAHELFSNGKTAAHPDNDQAWVNWFSGSPLRWEMIGMLFCSFGLSMMRLQDWDPIFNQPERHSQSRKSASCQMKECADACLSLRNRDHPKKDLLYCLFRNIGLLHSQIAGDECK